MRPLPRDIDCRVAQGMSREGRWSSATIAEASLAWNGAVDLTRFGGPLEVQRRGVRYGHAPGCRHEELAGCICALLHPVKRR